MNLLELEAKKITKEKSEYTKHNAMFLEMKELQMKLNKKVNPNWISASYDFLLAAWVEAAEILTHIPWKWWKAPFTPDLEQVQLEIVDIFHFILSYAIIEGISFDYIYRVYEETDYKNVPTVLEGIESFIESILTSTYHELFPTFFELCSSCKLDFEKVYYLYIGKNILNMFRQNNGYKTGEYIKIWNGKEDNYYLSELIQEYIENKRYGPNISEELYEDLTTLYSTYKHS